MLCVCHELAWSYVGRMGVQFCTCTLHTYWTLYLFYRYHSVWFHSPVLQATDSCFWNKHSLKCFQSCLPRSDDFSWLAYNIFYKISSSIMLFFFFLLVKFYYSLLWVFNSICKATKQFCLILSSTWRCKTST